MVGDPLHPSGAIGLVHIDIVMEHPGWVLKCHTQTHQLQPEEGAQLRKRSGKSYQNTHLIREHPGLDEGQYKPDRLAVPGAPTPAPGADPKTGKISAAAPIAVLASLPKHWEASEKKANADPVANITVQRNEK